MRQLVEGFQARVAGFITQREDLVLVVRCSEPDTVAVAKVLEGLDESSGSELYWTVTDAFLDATSYADSCVQAFATRHEALRLAMEQKETAPPPALPQDVGDPNALPPVERLRALIVFSRSLLPTLSGTGVVWSLLPFQVADRRAYAEFMTALWEHEFPFPWCHHVRIIVRDPTEGPVLEPFATAAARVSITSLDLSPDTIRTALEEQAGNEAVPLGERVNACLLLAGIDFSHGRYDRAIQQYDVVHRYAAVMQNPTLAVVALNGVADVLRTLGQEDQAALLLHTSLAPASLAPFPPVPLLQDIYQKLAAHYTARDQFAEAEIFLQGSANFAYVMRDPPQRLKALKSLGEVQYRQGKVDAALENWFAGAVVAGKLEMATEHEGFMGYLRGHYAQTNEEREFEALQARVYREINSEGEAEASP